METVIYSPAPTFQEILVLLAVSAGIVFLIVALWRAAWMLRASRRESPPEVEAAERGRRESAKLALAAIKRGKPCCGNCGLALRSRGAFCHYCGEQRRPMGCSLEMTVDGSRKIIPIHPGERYVETRDMKGNVTDQRYEQRPDPYLYAINAAYSSGTNPCTVSLP